MANPEVPESVPAAPIGGGDFSNLVASMSRWLRGLARSRPFSEGKVGLAEWIALSVLAEKPTASGKALGRRMGVGASRVDELLASLAEANLVAIDQKAGSGLREIRITDAGRAQVEAVNSHLERSLAGALKGKEKTVAIASKQMKILMRVLKDGASAGGEEKEARPA